jgi:glycosyltransferase involved in cell wall biosynthesis
MMRIALLAHVRHPIAPPFMGGMEAHSWHLARGLVARGHDVTLFAPGDSDAAGTLWPILPRSYGGDYQPGEPELNTWLDARFAKVAEALLEGDFDVIHNNCLHRYPPRLARQERLACVTSLHIPPFDTLHRAVQDSAAPWSRFTVTSARQVESWWDGAPPPQATVVHNGIDTTLWPFSPTGDGSAVWAGRITPNKGAHLAIRAAALAGIPLTLFGAIENRGYFNAEIVPFLQGDIRYGGHLPGAELAAEFGRASVLMFTPLWDEPFGLTAVEAMCCGLPVAALDMGAAREVIGEAGRFAADATPQDLADATLAALDIPRPIPRVRVLRHFTHDRMIADYEAEYASAIAGLSQPAPPVDFPAWDLCPVAPRPFPLPVAKSA